MNNIRIVLTLALMVISAPSFAGLGLKLSHFDPRGDMGQYFKNSLSYEIFYSQQYGDGPFRGRVGLFYTNMKPRLDTFPIYDVRTDYSTSTNTVLPGYLSYHKYRMYAMYVDQSVRAVKFKNFSAYAGIGITVGYMEEVYDYGIETAIISNGVDHSYQVGGIRTFIQAGYEVSGHIQLCAEVMHNWVTDKKWAGNYTHNSIGISLYYFFKSQK